MVVHVQIVPAETAIGPSLRRPRTVPCCLADPRPWKKALCNLALMLRNVVASALAALASGFLTSRGNIFSSVQASSQSRREFLVASLVKTHILGTIFGVLIAVSRLMRRRFLSRDNTKPGFRFCFCRVVKFASLHLVVSTAAVFFVGFGCAALPSRATKFKPEYYLSTAIGQYFSSACDSNVRFVLKYETVEGRERQHSRTRRRSSLQRLMNGLHAGERWLRSFMLSLPLLASAITAGLYIHICNRWTFNAGILANAFVAGSLMLKLVMQELAKHYLLRKRVTSLQHMCIVVGVPTVLIDTQARVVILGLQNVQSTMVNTVVLAVVELAVRFAKVMWLRLVVKRRLREIELTIIARRAAAAQSQQTGVAISSSSVGPEDARIGFLKWRKQVFGLHTAETHADMYAEYIAIVCSASAAIFWASNPQYTIGANAAGNGFNRLTVALVGQVLVELVVDYLASVIEIICGIELEHSRDLGGFLGSLFLMLTVVNMNMSAVLYIRDA